MTWLAGVTSQLLSCLQFLLELFVTDLVPRFGRRTFLVASPTVWNSLLDFIWDSTISADCIRRLHKRICSLDTSAFSMLEVPDDNCAL